MDLSRALKLWPFAPAAAIFSVAVFFPEAGFWLWLVTGGIWFLLGLDVYLTPENNDEDCGAGGDTHVG